MSDRRRSRTPLPDRVAQRGLLAALVSARRDELSLRQVELAELAGVGARFVNDLEAGKATVRLDKVLAVLGVLGLHLEVEYGTVRDGVGAGRRASELYGVQPRTSTEEHQP